MKKTVSMGGLILFLIFALWMGISKSKGNWQGVDETVVEKFAKEAGRPAREPLIPTNQGDLPLFCFLLAGAAGGFVGGYTFREIFHLEKKEVKDGMPL